MLKSYLLHIEQIVQETEKSLSIHFKQPPVDRIWYKAGQYLTFRFEIAGEEYIRSYSISTAPRLDDTIAITVKAVEGGIVSNYLLENAKPGMAMEVSRPLGRFLIENSVKEQRNIVLLGAGSGITPLYSILRSTLFNEPLSHVWLYYANSSPTDVIFREDLARLQRQFGNRFHLRQHFSQTEGRANAESIVSYVQTVPHANSCSFYLCGPAGWMKIVNEGLKRSHIASQNIYQESFAIPEIEQRAQLPASGPSREVMVQVGENNLRFRVPAGTTILDAGLSQGLNIPHSCKAGTCAACMGRILSGQISMDNNDALLDFEVEQGKVLVCQSHPESDDVSIRIGWS
ncbi:MAG: 2Fe-2S iron-sulfur cluster-binding protein [Bacteroidia bacterium]